MVLIGAHADTAETEYGWIQPGEPLGQIGATPILRVTRFWEKPSEVQAKACLEIRCFWNTFVLVAKLSTLLDVGRRILPDLSERMVRAAGYVAARQYRCGRARIWLCSKGRLFPNHSSGVPEALAVSPLPSVTWSDLGTPHMVMRTLQMTAPMALGSAAV